MVSVASKEGNSASLLNVLLQFELAGQGFERKQNNEILSYHLELDVIRECLNRPCNGDSWSEADSDGRRIKNQKKERYDGKDGEITYINWSKAGIERV